MLRWAAVLGIAGFLAGFIGPMFLSDGNQGPMTGLFITGPGGALLGLILGAVAAARGWSRRKNAQMLWSVTGAGVLLTLAAVLPEPRVVADLVEGDIRACRPPQELKASAVAGWREYEAHRPQPTTTDWGVAFDRALAETPGVVLTLGAARERNVIEKRSPWRPPVLKAMRWSEAAGERRYFVAGGDCAAYQPGARSILFVRGGVGYWPPHGAAELLGVRTAGPLPADHGYWAQ